MQHLDSFTVETTATRLYRRFHYIEIDERLKDWANEELRGVQEDLDRVLRFDDGFEDHLLDYIPREVEKWQSDSVDEIPYDDLRERPICTCDDLGCPLKNARLPEAVRDADDLQQGIKSWKQEHEGSPEVLIDGVEAWNETRAEVWHTLRRIETYLTPENDDLPDTAEPASAD